MGPGVQGSSEKRGEKGKNNPEYITFLHNQGFKDS